ncbi:MULTISPECIES: Asp-tRNA(Asn)/Glu-tRNA(Gln) amidotransferase subunit GatA [Brevibacillus]|uniref:Asp-tRNA(Asn)/Glu-tRNA(Gln) amidotransferase subunit GatA n=1 Tax=Brevibacillus TaxID=55080 RepID=UPI00046AB38D|nr:Asp-tRNA(Asn)/Glu-tRNA(Gln) amidotransferase subunit GatA [Brevibacillus borstelensis]KKX56113.1 glutamyl-tRNA amidotransferase [Brevibacillus borstelensis cifa_chp40]MBE5398352.1 Asp-tRNA(Asn)/Glu-tRNA(Gln) amidotransferase subunit GatA [Brevibacillus borstelensis]MCC0564789.1 Asp-tRNA(Asn)/Glu-tRNA(Gln) amidotransferase subunit GatA [Brevibacillus borstelensis]MCM3471042.1 Asp-tRNA(Asn)/Glu-tRNA(Gln) amidotransferase subunit GatA [Brevibacillus borstelensis]MCM3558223.1 Asp-tRNA(Asn)/Glu-
MSLFDKRLSEIHSALRSKELSVAELVQASIASIKEHDGEIKSVLHVDEEGALSQAKALDERLAGSGEEMGLLYGLPVGLKDNIVTRGLRTTCASKFLSNYDPIYDATVSKKLKDADALIVAKLNMDEFAMGGSNENSGFYPTKNPWNTEYVPGGSSGGSAAAMASRHFFFTLGSDTGGSIRQPAAFCGVVGLKPTYGRVSRFGLVAFASSLDQIGPITKNVEDSAYVLQAIAGHDEYDSTSAKVDVPDYLSALTGDVKGLRIGVPKELIGEGIDSEVRDAVLAALKQLESMGATWSEVSMPHTEYAVPAYYLLSSSEASSNLARFDGVRYGVRADNAENLIEMYKESRSQGFGPEVKRRIMLGTYALSSGYYDAYYKKAQQVRTLIIQDFNDVFAHYDVILHPTTPTTAFKIGQNVDDPVKMYLEDICTVPVNLAGLPAISVPCGFAQNGMPIGMQIVGKAFDESTVLRVAHAYEQTAGFYQRKPEWVRG